MANIAKVLHKVQKKKECLKDVWDVKGMLQCFQTNTVPPLDDIEV
jgi:hypothetical protein